MYIHTAEGRHFTCTFQMEAFLNFFSQFLSHTEKLRTSMIDDLNASNVFYKKRIEELGQRLQEQNELIITQRQQVFLAIGWCCFSLSRTVDQRMCFYFRAFISWV